MELRALLRKIQPDAVGIENFPDWQEAGVQFHPWLPEPAVAMSWAASAGVPVYGVKTGDNVAGWQSQARAIAELRDSSSSARSQASLTELRRYVEGQTRVVFENEKTFAWANSAAGAARRASDRQRYTDEQQKRMAGWDDELAEEIVALARRHRPGRLAIIMGSDHFGPTRSRLQTQSGMTVLPTASFFPLADAEIAEAWARWHMLFGRWDQAGPLLSRVRAGAPGADERLPVLFSVRVPPLPTYRALATFALATLHDMTGNHDVARPLYEELLALPAADPIPSLAARRGG